MVGKNKQPTSCYRMNAVRYFLVFFNNLDISLMNQIFFCPSNSYFLLSPRYWNNRHFPFVRNPKLSKHEKFLNFSTCAPDWYESGWRQQKWLGNCSTLCVHVVGRVCRLRSDKAVENPGLERKRGEQGRALSFCTGASCWPGQPEGWPRALWKDYAELNASLLSCMQTKCWQPQFLLLSMICFCPAVTVESVSFLVCFPEGWYFYIFMAPHTHTLGSGTGKAPDEYCFFLFAKNVFHN